MESLPVDILTSIASYLPNRTLLLLHDISQIFREIDIEPLLRYNLSNIIWFDIETYNFDQLVNLAQFTFTNSNINAGFKHSLVLLDNQVYAFGSNTDGQLGLGDYNTRSTPTLISNLDNVVQVATGLYHSLALTRNNQVYIFGLASTNRYLSNTPTLIDISKINDKIIQIAVGGHKSFFLTDIGQVYKQNSRGLPELMPKLMNIVAISANDIEIMGLTIDNKIIVIEKDNKLLIFEDFTDENIIQISLGKHHALILTEHGSVYAIGNNKHGQLGIDEKFTRDPQVIEFTFNNFGK